MSEHFLLGIATIFVLGFVAQWVAWRFRLPSILLLLIGGFLVGPLTGFLDPDELFGDMLFPVVSLSVAVILFEGGLSLRLSELKEVGLAVRNLVSIGVLITWVLSGAAAYFILNLNLALAVLFGAILVVTGPTVIVPLLRHIRPVGRVGKVAKWEGIVNDPIGAVLAVLVFEAVLAVGFQEATSQVAIGLLKTVLVSGLIGFITAGFMTLMLKSYWVPGFLQNGFSLMLVVAAFTLSDVFQAESGLVTVTIIGVALANQRVATIQHIIEFKENLRILLISALFIILTARLSLADLSHLGWDSLYFLIVLILIVRPVSVLASTFKSELSLKEKLFLSWMAPRGIVAAAVTSIFALELAEQGGYTSAELMAPEMFWVIAGTVTIYGLTAAPVGRWLGVAQPNPQGVLIVGASAWAQAMAEAIKQEGFTVLLVDNNRENIKAARLSGLPTHYASILSEYVFERIDLGGMGRLLAVTDNDAVNSLAALYFREAFDQSGVYQLTPEETEDNRKQMLTSPLRGRPLFNAEATYAQLTEYFENGYEVKKTNLTEKFDYDAFRSHYNGQMLPLFLIDKASGSMTVFTTDQNLSPQPGQTLISLVKNHQSSQQPAQPTTQPANQAGQPPTQPTNNQTIKPATYQTNHLPDHQTSHLPNQPTTLPSNP